MSINKTAGDTQKSTMTTLVQSAWEGVQNQIETSGLAVNSWFWSRTWERTPGFMKGFKNKSIRRLDLPMNDFSFQKDETAYPVGSMRLRTYNFLNLNWFETIWSGAISTANGGSYFTDPLVLLASSMPPIDVQSVQSLARERFLLESKDQKVNLVQAFAERRQTARLMENTIYRIVGAINSLKRGDLIGAAAALGTSVSGRQAKRFAKDRKADPQKAVADWWLELQYGWKPLLSDVVGSAELLAQKNIREVRNRVSKSASKSNSIFSDSGIASFPRKKWRISRRVTCKYVAYYSTSEVNHTLAQVGITNPLYIAWELVPWSFVVDWFIPIGNYINSLDATNGLTFEKGCLTTFEEILVTSWTVSARAPSPQGPLYPNEIENNSSPWTHKRIKVTRTKLTSFPDAALPSFKNPFSGIHVANALALLKATFKVRY